MSVKKTISQSISSIHLVHTTLFFLLLLLYACSSDPFISQNRIYKKQTAELASNIISIPPIINQIGIPGYKFVGTTNFGLRRPNYVVIHNTSEDSYNKVIEKFTDPKSRVSSHYLITKDGIVIQLLNDNLRAWHAGMSKWGSNTDINSSSIGVELDNNGAESFPEIQIKSLLALLQLLKIEYKIPTLNFIGHSDITSRKVDPSSHFPWSQLAQNGFGLWRDSILKVPDKKFNSLMALRLIGYDTSDSTLATISFKRHYIQNDTSGILTDFDKSVLFNITNKVIREF